MKLHIPTLLRLAKENGLALLAEGEYLIVEYRQETRNLDLWIEVLKRHKRDLLPHLPPVEPPM